MLKMSYNTEYIDKGSGLKFRKLEPRVRSAIAKWKCGPQNGPQKCSQNLNILSRYAAEMWSAYPFYGCIMQR